MCCCRKARRPIAQDVIVDLRTERICGREAAALVSSGARAGEGEPL